MAVFNRDLLDTRVALVTGGATGIGREIALSFAAHGASVVLASRKVEVLDAAQRDFAAQGYDCMVLPCDVRDSVRVEAIMAEISARHGRLDIVVNNAAGNFPATIDGLSYNGFKTIVDIDLLGTYNVTKASYQEFLQASGGVVINIAAPFEHWGVSYQAHVAAAKTGVISLTRTCAVEWASKGIRVNAIAPGFIDDTEGVERFAQVTKQAGAAATQGLQGTKQDIANTALFLASDAASFISGECIRVDGASCVDLLKMPVE